MPRILVTHAVLHCTAGSSDKIWAGVVVAQPGEPAQTYTAYGRRGGTLNVSTKAFPTTPDALRYFDQKMVEKLERHDYRRCHWQDRHYGVRYDLPSHFPELYPLQAMAGREPDTAALTYLALPRPNSPAAYGPGIYEVDQETRWWYVVPDAVGYGYALSPNAMLVARGFHAFSQDGPPDDATMVPTWVWRAGPRSAALLAPKRVAWHPGREEQVLARVQLELIASVLG